MSWVANLLVVSSRADARTVEALSTWLETEAPRRGPSISFGPTEGTASGGVGSLRTLTDPEDNQWGGWKNPECCVWGGALNHADLDALLDQIQRLPWVHPGSVQILLMDQEQSYFRLYMYRDGNWKNYAPDPPPDASDQMAW